MAREQGSGSGGSGRDYFGDCGEGGDRGLGRGGRGRGGAIEVYSSVSFAIAISAV